MIPKNHYRQILENLEFLKLPCMHDELINICDRVDKRELSFMEAMLFLTNQEVDQRTSASLKRAIARACFPHRKELKDFDFDFQESVDRSEMYNLASLSFVEEHKNVILIGSPGVGKTHLATALGIEAAKHHMSVYFTKTTSLLETLRRAKEENRLDRCLKYYNRFRLLILDELGFLPVKRGDEKLLFQLIDMRYEQKSTIITSNVHLSQWNKLFEDPRITNAILDRLLHHSHLLQIVGPSYRMKDYDIPLDKKEGDKKA